MTSPNNHHYTQTLASRYAPADLETRLRSALQDQGLNPEQLDLDTIAAIDQLHVGGRAASRRLMARAGGIAPTQQVLDLGCGTGGSSRLLVQEYGLLLTGIDITLEFIAVAQWLSRATGLADHSRFVCGDVQSLPFADQSYDLLWAQHVMLNVPARHAAIAQAQRVLRPQGRILLHEVIQGEQGGALQFPVPWADTPEQSHIPTQAELVTALETAGLRCLFFDDISAEALQWRQKHTQRETLDATTALNPTLIFGSRFKTMGRNLMDNLAAGRIRIVHAGFIKTC